MIGTWCLVSELVSKGATKVVDVVLLILVSFFWVAVAGATFLTTTGLDGEFTDDEFEAAADA